MGYEDVKGDQPAFPSGALPGMTYRQWLVGQALNGLLAFPGRTTPDAGEVAEVAIEVADKVIEKLRG